MTRLLVGRDRLPIAVKLNDPLVCYKCNSNGSTIFRCIQCNQLVCWKCGYRTDRGITSFCDGDCYVLWGVEDAWKKG